MDRSQLRNRVITKLAVAPTVLVPTVLGATTLLGAWASGHPAGLASFLGLTGLLVGAGAFVTRWIFGLERAVEEVVREAEQERRDAAEAALDDLADRLAGDDDDRTEQALQRLRAMQVKFQRDLEAGRDGMSSGQLAEIASKSDRLFRSCVASLERSLRLWDSARRMNTAEARDAALEARERVLDEVATSIEQLARVYDGVSSLTLLEAGGGTMADLGRELEESMRVARRVEERMRSIQSSLEGDPDWKREGGRWE